MTSYGRSKPEQRSICAVVALASPVRLFGLSARRLSCFGVISTSRPGVVGVGRGSWKEPLARQYRRTPASAGNCQSRVEAVRRANLRKIQQFLAYAEKPRSLKHSPNGRKNRWDSDAFSPQCSRLRKPFGSDAGRGCAGSRSLFAAGNGSDLPATEPQPAPASTTQVSSFWNPLWTWPLSLGVKVHAISSSWGTRQPDNPSLTLLAHNSVRIGCILHLLTLLAEHLRVHLDTKEVLR